jgi:LacI family transcriptional regulator
MATVQDIADFAGVSTATVSRVLNKSEAVSPETVAKVNEAIKELKYERKALKRKRTDLFGIIVPDITNPFFAELLDVIEREAFFHGRCVLFFNSRHNTKQEKLYLNECLNHEVDGVFLIPTCMDEAYLNEIKKYKFPTIMLTRSTEIIPSVSVDHAEGGRLVAEHLISIGHTKIGYVGPINHQEDKLTGFSSVLEEKKEPIRREFMFDCCASPEKSELKQFIQSLVDKDGQPKVSAINCTNDVTAEKVQNILYSLNINVPEQIAVIGFDNSLTAKTLDMTSISQPMREIAHLGFEQMLECIKEAEKQKTYPPKVLLPRLVLRNSVLKH